MRALPILAFAALVLAGCAGAESTGGAEGAPDVIIDETLGRVQGQVLDEEFRALGNATVSLPALSILVSTDLLGNFDVPNVQPGDYDIMAYALGYEAQGRRIKVEATLITTATFTLKPLPVNGTYHESHHFVGFQACQWYFEGTIAHCTLPYTAAHGAAKQNGVNLTQYGLPPDVQGNKDRFNFSVRPDNTGVVSELAWQAGSAAGTYQMLVIMCPWYDPVWDECIPPDAPPGTVGNRYFNPVGKSPIRIAWEHPEPKHLLMAPYVWSRANVNGADDQPVGLAFDQKIQFYNTVFYGGKPPEDFSAAPPDG